MGGYIHKARRKLIDNPQAGSIRVNIPTKFIKYLSEIGYPMPLSCDLTLVLGEGGKPVIRMDNFERRPNGPPAKRRMRYTMPDYGSAYTYSRPYRGPEIRQFGANYYAQDEAEEGGLDLDSGE